MNNRFFTQKILTIIKHEYLTKIRSKGFIIGTIFGPLILILIIGIPSVVTYLSMGTTEKKLAVKDYTERFGAEIVNYDKTKYYLTQASEDELSDMIVKEESDGYIVIPKDFLQSGNLFVYTRGGCGLGFLESIQNVAGKILRRQRLLDAGTDIEVIKLVEKGVNIQTQKITEKGMEKDYAEMYAILGYILGFAIYGMMFAYGSLVMRGVIEEKANRIVEVIASSAKPFEIMMGKIFGIGAVGLTQVLFWIIMAVIILVLASPVLQMFMPDAQTLTQGMKTPGSPAIPSSFEIPDISIWVGVAFIFYFLSGYFIYSTLFAAVGSAVDQEQDAAQLQTPVTLPIIIPIFFIFNIMQNPDGIVAIILSLIPFFAPILMIVRIASTNVPAWQIITSVVLIIITFLGCVWMASKIYRVGILMYGKKPKLSDLIKWIKLAK